VQAESPLLEKCNIETTCECTIQANSKANPDDSDLRLPPGRREINISKMSLEKQKHDPIGAAVGEFGPWQLRAVLLIFLCKIPSSWFMACILFTAPGPKNGEFYCEPPKELANKDHSEWITFSHPEVDYEVGREFNVDFCSIFKDAHHHVKDVLNEPNGLVWNKINRSQVVVPCESFQHNSIYDSIITQFDLVCTREILVAVTQFFHLFGVLLGGCIATKLLEFISPRRLMVIGMITQIIAGNLTGFAPYYGMHVVFRCLSAICCGQMYTAGGMICKLFSWM